MMFYIFFHPKNKHTYNILLACVVFLAVAASVLLARVSFSHIQPGDYNSYVCKTTSKGKPTFRILTLTSFNAVASADRLCNSATIANLFSAVEIHWHPKKYLKAQHILDGEFDYFWNRQHVVEGLVPELGDYYLPLLQSDNLKLYWLSLEGKPELTQAYFANKTVGFLSGKRSHSYLLEPTRSLKSAGIVLERHQKKYYATADALIDGFLSGEVDVISGMPNLPPWHVRDQQLYSLLITENLSTGVWYLSNKWLGSGIECVLFLSEISVDFKNSKKHSSLLMPLGCENDLQDPD